MIKPKRLLLPLLISVCYSSTAQTPAELLDTWSLKSPIEKVYLHLDREHFIAGETGWFKAYLYSDYQPDTISTVLYVELLNSNGGLIYKCIVPVLFGTASGHIDLPDSLNEGDFLLRSYTPSMMNQPAEFTGKQLIHVTGRKNQNPPIREKKWNIELFPEGGNLFSGASNFVAFKASNEYGLPVSVKGKLFDDKNQFLKELDTWHDGMGLFEFTPLQGSRYYVVVNDDPLATKYYISDPTKKAIAFSVIPHPQGFMFEISEGNDPDFRAAYMVGQMQHHSVFRQDLKNIKNQVQGVLNTKNLHSGILQITVFNEHDQPLAERLCFVDNKEYRLEGRLNVDTVNFSSRAKNKFNLQISDTVRGSFSVSVTDASIDKTEREENIYTSLLLTSDISGFVNRPAWYFSSNEDSVKTALDLVMMTNGWRRFKWEELSSQLNKPLIKDPVFITISGKITLRDLKKPFEDKNLMMLLITADSTRRVQMVRTDRQGNFRIDSMLFFGKSRLLFSDIRGKNSSFIDAHLSGDSINRTFKFGSLKLPEKNLAFLMNNFGYEMDYEAIFKEKGFILQNVTVKSGRKKTPLEILDEKYATGSFSGEALKVYDLVNNDDWKFYSDVFSYLNAHGYKVGSRNTSTVSSMGAMNTEIYLDGYLISANVTNSDVISDLDILETIPMSRIAMIKVYSSFVGSAGNAPGGVIAIFTKKGEDALGAADSRTSMVTYNGYTITKEFYAPDYSVNKTTQEKDNRITIDWRPDILVNHVNPRIPFSFYNNDRTKKFRIIIEGMTIDGKMLFIDKTF